MKKIIVIADWVLDTLSCQEFRSVVEGYAKNPDNLNISFVNSSFSSINTGFIAYQIQLTEIQYGKPLETLIFINTDFRKDILDNNLSQFLIAKLISGITVCGPNTGYSYSFISNKIERLYKYSYEKTNSQFRSRDIFARICSHISDEMESELELEEVSVSSIIPLEKKYIAHIDNFGNIKTTFLLSDFKGKYEYGDIVTITMNNIIKKAVFIKGLFSGKMGELSIYPGSSGEKDNPFLEISTWRDFANPKHLSGKEIFMKISPGDEIKIQ